MYAIVEIAGQQFRVEKGQELMTHRLEGKEGAKVSFDQVLLLDNGGKVTVGKPAASASVKAEIVGHVPGDKVVVFKKKRRKGYAVKNGHRQSLTHIRITDIVSDK